MGGGGNAGLTDGQSHYFALSELGYQDADGDSLDHITILSPPTQGSLSLYGYSPVTNGQSIDAYSLGSGYLVYTPDSNSPASFSTSFAFSVRDGDVNRPPASLTLNLKVEPNTSTTITEKVFGTSVVAPDAHSDPKFANKTLATTPSELGNDVGGRFTIVPSAEYRFISVANSGDTNF